MLAMMFEATLMPATLSMLEVILMPEMMQGPPTVTLTYQMTPISASLVLAMMP